MAATTCTVTDTSAIEPGTSDFAVEFRMTPTTGSFYYDPTRIAMKYDTDNDVGWKIQAQYVNPSWFLEAVLAKDGNNIVTATGTANAMASGTEIHVAVNFDRDGNMRGYINGSAVTGCSASISALSASIANTNNLIIGASHYYGYIREFRYYSRVLTTTEITYNYNNPDTPYDMTSMLIWLKCDEGTGTRLMDSSGNGNFATLSTSSWVEI
jgi:hypothetical protein